MDDVTLGRLCRLHNIATTWTDIWGRVHDVSAATQRALLRAMHIPVDDEPAVTAAITQENTRRWQRPLPPVLVASESEDVEVELRRPSENIEESLPYTIELEDGSTHTATLIAGATVSEDTIDGVRYASRLMRLSPTPAPGYHRVIVPTLGVDMRLIVAPRRCYLPAALADSAHVWGPSLQLYALRSRRNWGIGDFTDLRHVTEHFSALGADTIGVSPLHALFPHNPTHASPYSPSSRLFLNVLFLDVEVIPDFARCTTAQQMVRFPAFRERLAALRAAHLVDYAAVLDLKMPVLEVLYQHFREHELANNTERGCAFTTFVADGGERLHRHTLYEALQDHFKRQTGATGGWSNWPEAYRNPSSPIVATFSAQHHERVEFFAYLQWQAEEQLAAVGRRAADLQLGVGLYQDLSLSVDRDGAEAWANQTLYAEGASIGAPPDDFSPQGQNWGLPPMIPQRLYESRYDTFIATLRANMRHAGALRIDHVMGLMRLFWIPAGGRGADGAYVYYPVDDLLGIVALESQRNRCLVIGEDLGTVPDEVRDAMKRIGMLSYRLLYFERDRAGDFLPPADYVEDALVAISTHDLPTLAGYWRGEDVRERCDLGLFTGDGMRSRQMFEREQDRARLLTVLLHEGLLPGGVTTDPASCPEMTPELARAIHELVARTRSRMMMVQVEDIVGQTIQVNLPGTSDERANWRRRLTLDLEDLVEDPRTKALAASLRSVRPPHRSGRSG